MTTFFMTNVGFRLLLPLEVGNCSSASASSLVGLVLRLAHFGSSPRPMWPTGGFVPYPLGTGAPVFMRPVEDAASSVLLGWLFQHLG